MRFSGKMLIGSVRADALISPATAILGKPSGGVKSLEDPHITK
jgi:hypothetical protein